jgi:hypothetical protein
VSQDRFCDAFHVLGAVIFTCIQHSLRIRSRISALILGRARRRDRQMSQRTGIINQIRAFMLERGIAVRQGIGFLRTELPTILATRTDALTSECPRPSPCRESA